jgi:HD-GYP domain-containing protein (c-di-GMP phosphodiesterase class II)
VSIAALSRIARSPSKELVQVDVHDLQVGLYVSALDRPWLETPFLFQGFEIRDTDEIIELQKQCKHVHVDVDECAKSVDIETLYRVSKPVTTEPERLVRRPAAAVDGHVSVYTDIAELRRELATARDQHDRAMILIREVMDNLSGGGKLDVKTAERAAEPIVESVMNNRSAMTWLVRMREMSDYLYTHSVSSAIWATVMARHIGMPKESIEAAGLGAMLLDIGKTQLPPELLSKPGPLTKAEMTLAHRHVEYGIKILEESKGISPQVLAMVRTHHERHDGSGYPNGLSGQQIPVLGRIGGIVDYYDAVTSERPYAAPLSSYDCLRSLNKLAGSGFQAEMVEQFIQSIGFFPPGTLVQLNDGSVAVVVAQNRRHRLKPEILVILDPERNLRPDFGLIDLQMQVKSAYTDEVLYIDKGLEPGAFGIDPAEFFLA